MSVQAVLSPLSLLDVILLKLEGFELYLEAIHSAKKILLAFENAFFELCDDFFFCGM